MFVLRLFGGAQIENEAGVITGGAAQRHRLALLALLTIALPRGLSREKLIGYLWPEGDSDHARNLLNQAVHAVRQALGAEALLSIGDELRLNAAVVGSDVAAFEEALATGDLEGAIDRYEGPFLDGFFLERSAEFERWLVETRDRLEREYARALQGLAKAAESAGDFGASAEWWRRLLALDPYSERAVLGLMQSLEAAGDRAGAIRQADLHAALLREELDAEPDPEVEALAKRIRIEPAVPAATGTVLEAPVRQELRHVSSVGSVREKPSATHRRRRRRSWTRAGTIGAGLVALAVAGWAMVTDNRSDPEEIHRLAVLPLANLTGDPNQEYFVAGMHDALVTELSQIPALTVISRQSTVQYQGSDRPLPVIASELGVEALVEGSVFLAGDSVRITVQLVRAEPEEHLWASTYHGSLRNALTLQGEVARAIARAIQAKAAPEAQVAIASTRPVNPAAQEAYLKGLYYLERHMLGLSPESDQGQTLRTAIAYLQEAVALDPEWATAHAKLARAYHWIASGGDPDLAAEYYPKSKAAALRALELDETEAQAHASLGFVLLSHERDWAGAEREIQRAMELDPNSYHWIYALYLSAVGRYDDAITRFRLAEERHPLSTPIKSQLAWAYSCAGRHDEAVAQLEELAGQAGVEEGWIQAAIGTEYLAKAMHAEAIGHLENAVSLSDSVPGIVAELANGYARAGRSRDARRLVSWLEEHSGQWHSPTLYVALGDTERAVAMVQAEFEENPDAFLYFLCSPSYRELGAEPRIQEIVRRIGFPS